jgi:hypothetical protein
MFAVGDPVITPQVKKHNILEITFEAEVNKIYYYMY